MNIWGMKRKRKRIKKVIDRIERKYYKQRRPWEVKRLDELKSKNKSMLREIKAIRQERKKK